MCLSDEQLLRDCPKLTPSKNISLVKNVFSLNTITGDSDECCEALDAIQDSDDSQLDKHSASIKFEEASEVNLATALGSPDQSISDIGYEHKFHELADRAF